MDIPSPMLFYVILGLGTLLNLGIGALTFIRMAQTKAETPSGPSELQQVMSLLTSINREVGEIRSRTERLPEDMTRHGSRLNALEQTVASHQARLDAIDRSLEG